MGNANGFSLSLHMEFTVHTLTDGPLLCFSLILFLSSLLRKKTVFVKFKEDKNNPTSRLPNENKVFAGQLMLCLVLVNREK